MFEKIWPKVVAVSKGIAGAVVGASAYVIASGFEPADITWWAGLAIWLGAGFGIVWVAPANRKIS